MILHLFSRFKKKFSDTPLWWLLKVSGWCVALFFLFVGLFKYAEAATWEESIWQAWQTFTTVGYGNAPAETTEGRVVTMFVSTLGIAFVGALFSAAFDYKQYLKDKKRFGYMENTHKNGYVVFNFPEGATAYNLIRELRTVEKKVSVCFVDSELEELPESISRLPNIHFVKGDTMQKSTYESAGIKDAQAVLVFPMRAGVAESDAATKTIVDLIARFTAESDTRIIYTLVDAQNNWMFDAPRATHVLADLEVLAMVQECQDEKSAEIVEKLLLNTEGANPQTVVPKKVIGWTWGELTLGLIKASEQSKVACNPFALITSEGTNTCPSFTTKIQEGDRLSIIAHHGFDWEKTEDLLSKQSDLLSV